MGTDPKIESPEGAIIFFDGVCNLCNGSVQFIINRDTHQYFRFASLQSGFATSTLAEHEVIPSELESIILLEKGKIFIKSEAALRISKKLSSLWPLLAIFKIIPIGFRNGVYDWVANNRYKWFGKRDFCMIPTMELKARFIET